MTELSLVVKATILLIAGLAAASAARKSPASMRHMVLAWTFGALLIFPAARMFVPAVEISIPVSGTATSPAPSTLPPAAFESPAVQDARVVEPARAAFSVSWLSLIRGGWAAAASILLIAMGVTLWRLNRIRRRALPWAERLEFVRAEAAKAGVRRNVDVLLSHDITTPLTFGFLRPAIILPLDAAEWSQADVDRAVVHEVEHVRRKDWMVYVIARTTWALYWFHPLVWVAWRKLCVEAERACDDAVLQLAERTEYAEQLVQLARRITHADQPALAMANRSDLASRITAILDSAQPRGRVRASHFALASASALGIALLLAPMITVGIPENQYYGLEATPANETPSGVEFQRGPGSRLDRALVEAAGDGDITDIGELLAAGAQVNAAVDGDGSPLIAAAREGHRAAVEFLLNNGADPNMPVSGDGNPLIMAAREGHLGIVELLLNRGARIDEVVPGDENALIQASAQGHLPVVKLLVTRGADVNIRVWSDAGFRSNGEWRSPLSMAERAGHRAVIDYLISSGARR